jgi:geranylgeranyl diphosphate synthase type I
MTTMKRSRTPEPARPVTEVLDWGRDALGPALRAAVDTLPSSMWRIAGYHLGWWDEHGRPSQADGGKAIRPTLTLLAAQAVGGEAAVTAAVPAAVAVELVHNFSLLHDDVIDGDVTRRHRPTAWTVFGNSPAILAGDALLTLAFEVLAGSGRTTAGAGARMLNAAVLDLIDGQSADLAFEQRSDVDVAECLTMAGGKTAALLGCAAAIGALFGGGRGEQVEALRGFGQDIGLAFQLVDDLLGIWGDPAVTGKPVHSDLHNRKKSLPVVAALTSGGPAADELAALYDRTDELAGPEVARAAELVELAGGRDWSRKQVAELLNSATERLRTAEVPEQAAAELIGLAELLTRRDH